MFNTPRLGEKLIMLLPIWLAVLGTIFAMIARDPFGSKVLVGIVLIIIGFILFFKSKLRKLREGQLSSFGIKDLNAKEKKLYIIGYFLMVSGLIIEIV
jgi:undecaprenyl pyrophosphate phosphatase UppP